MQTFYVPSEGFEMTPEQMIYRINELSDICEQHDKGCQFWEKTAFERLSKIRDLESKLKGKNVLISEVVEALKEMLDTFVEDPVDRQTTYAIDMAYEALAAVKEAAQ